MLLFGKKPSISNFSHHSPEVLLARWIFFFSSSGLYFPPRNLSRPCPSAGSGQGVCSAPQGLRVGLKSPPEPSPARPVSSCSGGHGLAGLGRVVLAGCACATLAGASGQCLPRHLAGCWLRPRGSPRGPSLPCPWSPGSRVLHLAALNPRRAPTAPTTFWG